MQNTRGCGGVHKLMDRYYTLCYCTRKCECTYECGIVMVELISLRKRHRDVSRAGSQRYAVQVPICISRLNDAQ